MQTHETELKFLIPAEHLAGVRAAMASGAPRVRMQAQYVDTADGTLAAARIALRLRKEGRRWVQTLKAPGDSAVHRLEHEVVLPAQRGVPALDIARHHGSEAGRALERVLKKHHGGGPAALLARHATDVWRRRLRVDAPGGQVEIAFDEGRVIAAGAGAPVCEIEFELKAGAPAALFDVARRWQAAHGLWLGTLTKAERGELLAAGAAERPPVKARVPRVDGAMDGDALLRAVVASCLDQIVGNAGEIGAGRFGADHVHQLRIGMRRLRSVLREIGSLSDRVDPAWEAALADAFQALGAYRDREAAAGAVQPGLRAAGAPAVELSPPVAGDVPPPAQAVRAQAFQSALLGLLAFTLTPPAVAAVGATQAHDLLRRRLRRLHRRVADEGRRFEALEEDAQHGVRKRLKRLRYVAEAVAPLFGERAVERYLKHLRPAQDALGAHNDAHVAQALYRQQAERDPKAWFAVGWLQARQAASAAACGRALEQAAKAPKFWNG